MANDVVFIRLVCYGICKVQYIAFHADRADTSLPPLYGSQLWYVSSSAGSREPTFARSVLEFSLCEQSYGSIVRKYSTAKHAHTEWNTNPSFRTFGFGTGNLQGREACTFGGSTFWLVEKAPAMWSLQVGLIFYFGFAAFDVAVELQLRVVILLRRK